MSEQFKEQISEFIDDELSAEECDFFVRRLQRDPDGRSQYLRYQLIGAAVRGEHLLPGGMDLRERLQNELLAAEAPPRVSLQSWGRYAAGAGIAASVALVAVFGLRFMQGPDGLSDDLVADTGLTDLPSYVVPENSGDPRQLVSVPVQLTGLQYLMHHGAYASGLSRTVLHSNVVAGQESNEAADAAAESENLGSDAIE
ncbi:MAG: RseA family anti-sigma factor [Gammaproteobacteria bacterium]|nr:RseA family anti-sigma factor [Gammaproteobacteria bacterium]